MPNMSLVGELVKNNYFYDSNVGQFLKNSKTPDILRDSIHENEKLTTTRLDAHTFEFLGTFDENGCRHYVFQKEIMIIVESPGYNFLTMIGHFAIFIEKKRN
jgi:hypothetical protein